MTACIIFKGRDGVHVLTDAAVHDADGRMLCLKPKVAHLPDINTVIVTRGPVNVLATLSGGLLNCGADDAADLMDRLPQAVPRALSTGLGLGHYPPTHFELFVAGWSATRDCALVRSVVGDTHDGGNLAFNDIDGVISPSDPAFLASIREQGFDQADIDPERDGLWIMEKQRRLPGSMVGGFCQLTTVTREGIATKVLRRWTE